MVAVSRDTMDITEYVSKVRIRLTGGFSFHKRHVHRGNIRGLKTPCPIINKLTDEYLNRLLPERTVYIPIEQRSISDECKKRIGDEVAALMNRHGHKLGNISSDIGQLVTPIIRAEYTKEDNLGNISKNHQLQDEINRRIEHYLEEVEKLCTVIQSGATDEPIKLVREFERRTQW